MFEATEIKKGFFKDSVSSDMRGRAISLFDKNPRERQFRPAKVHDANFAFLSTTLAKLHETVYDPLSNTTWAEDIDVDLGGGFVDYTEYYTYDFAGIMDEVRNVFGNNANYIPRVNAGMTQNRALVYTFEIAYDLRFVELEKMKKITLQKSIQDIYEQAILVGWNFFVQKVVYTGINGQTGLFNSANVYVGTIDNSATTGSGFEGLQDDAVVSFFNGIFAYYLKNSNMNIRILPDTFLVPTYVSVDLTDRMSALYTNTLRRFITEFNLAKDESAGEVNIRIRMREELDDAGTLGYGRIIAYKKDKKYLRVDMPYPIQHYITLPNIDKMSYTTAFVGQVSQVQMPYNVNSAELGVVSYWDFTTRVSS